MAYKLFPFSKSFHSGNIFICIISCSLFTTSFLCLDFCLAFLRSHSVSSFYELHGFAVATAARSTSSFSVIFMDCCLFPTTHSFSHRISFPFSFGSQFYYSVVYFSSFIVLSKWEWRRAKLLFIFFLSRGVVFGSATWASFLLRLSLSSSSFFFVMWHCEKIKMSLFASKCLRKEKLWIFMAWQCVRCSVVDVGEL